MAVLDIFEKEKLVERAAEMGAYLREKLEELYKYPIVGDVRGMGLLQAVELVADKKTRALLQPPGQVGGFVRDYCYRHNMILRNNEEILVVAPPLVITREIIDEMVGNIDAGIAAAVKHFGLG